MANTLLYRKVYDALRGRIERQEYQYGVPLPSEARLAEEFAVSSITIRRALHELTLDGLLERRHGVGNFVREPSHDIVVGLSNFTSMVASGRLQLVRTLLKDDLVAAAPEAASRLQVQVGSLLRHLMRLDAESGVPLSIDDVLIPPSLAGAVTHEMAASPVFMHLWQQASGLEFVRTQYEFSVRMPSDEEQALLQIDVRTPLLITGELIFNQLRRPMGWVETRYRGDRCRLSGMVQLTKQRTPHGTIGE